MRLFCLGSQDPHDSGMIEPQADLLLALKTLVEDEIGLELNVRHLEHDGMPALGIACAKDRRHAAARDHFLDLVLIERLPRNHVWHGFRT